MSELLGQYIGRYHISERLGAGGMATVYKAFDSRLERDVAVKFIRPEIVKDEMFLKRFEREAKALARLSHPNIVKVLDYGEHEGSPYLVMEYIRGDTLKAKLGKPMPWREAARMLLPIAEALDYTHKHNIIHRDVKPSNFLVSESGHLMLSDFGIAKMLDSPDAMQLTGTGIGIGTPEYMAPEQGLGQTVDQRADVYSLGIVFYEMLTGQKPYRADTPMAVMYKQISDPLPSPHQYVPSLPDFVERVVFKTLAKKPEERYQDMAGFAKALQGLIESSDAEATLLKPSETLQAQTVLSQTAEPLSSQKPFTQQPITHQPFTQQPETWGSQPSSVPAQPTTHPEKRSSKMWITCGVAVIAMACIIILLVTGGFGALIALFGPPPEGLVVTMSVPQQVEMGREFEVVINLYNEGDKEIKVSEIQVPQVMLDIATLSGTTPLSRDSIVYNSTGTTGYKFELPIAPGSNTDVRFRFQPKQTADITGEWRIGVGTRTATSELRVLIVEQTAQQPTNTPAPSATTALPTSTTQSTQAEATPGWILVWEDNFSDPESGFYEGESEDRAFWYEDGQYLIEGRKSNWITWMYLGYSLTDTQLSVDTYIERGTGTTAYGVLCRYQGEGDFYGFEFSEDGYYTIWLRYQDEYTNLVAWTYDSRLIGTDWRRMTIECVGDRLSLKLGDELLAQAQDATLTYGDVGLLVESNEIGGSLVKFDNFALYEK